VNKNIANLLAKAGQVAGQFRETTFFRHYLPSAYRLFFPRWGSPFMAWLVAAIWHFFLIVVAIPIVYVEAVKGDWFGMFGSMPGVEQLESPKVPTPSELYTADGKFLGRFYRENRSPVRYQDLSANLLEALYATEDIRFNDHSGIDLPATLSIIWYNLRGDNRGGSTISQQLAKNLFRTRKKESKGKLSDMDKKLGTLVYKTKEWITAISLEQSYTKEEIMTMYFNTVEFGGNAFGIKTAAKTFFSTTPDKLTVPQAAMLVGMLKAPTTYSPVRNPERAKNRRNTVLAQMLKYGYLDSAQHHQYCGEPIGLKKTIERQEEGAAMYFRGVMNQYLEKWCEENDLDLYADGLKIYTTIDSTLQALAEEAVAKKMKEYQRLFERQWGDSSNPWRRGDGTEIPNYIENIARKIYPKVYAQVKGDSAAFAQAMSVKRKMKLFSWKDGEVEREMGVLDSIRYCKRFLHGGLMSMNPYNGHIRAWVGGISYKYFKYDHVKQSRRQPGSTFKPFVYAAAIDSFGFSPCTSILDAPVLIRYKERKNPKQLIWQPHNTSYTYTMGQVSIRYGMGRSLNSVAARVTDRIGWGSVIAYAKKMGITTPLDSVPSVSLGSSDVTLFDMVGAYSSVVNEGVWNEPQFITRIEDRNGRIIHRFRSKSRRAMSPESAFLMVHMLRGGLQESGGTSRRLYSYPTVVSGNEVGGKTGTSQNYADGWYMGITRDLVTGVWVGGDDSSIHFRNQQGEGSKSALPIFGTFMESVYKYPDGANVLKVSKGRFPTEKDLNLDVKKNINCPSRYWGPRTDSTGQAKPDSLTAPAASPIINN
jgi:penicillin-binding protein 1A